MTYRYTYRTPNSFDDLLMNSDGDSLTGLWFAGSRDEAKHRTDCTEQTLPIFHETARWLDMYFSGKQPDFTPTYTIAHQTPFRKEVSERMLKIPFGIVLTYGDIARQLEAQRGSGKVSARAVGGAVGWNPLCIIIPCHRVVGSNRSLTGYGGGIKNKIALLALEGNDISRFVIPSKGTAL